MEKRIKTKQFNFRLDPELMARVKVMAQAERRTLTNMLEVIAADAVEKWEKKHK